MIRRPPGGVGLRIAAAAILVAAVALVILAGGVIVVGSQTFAALMAKHGFSTASSDAMFQDAVVRIVLLAAAVAVVVAVVLAALISARLVRPLREIGAAARRIAEAALPDERFYGTILRVGLPKTSNTPKNETKKNR